MEGSRKGTSGGSTPLEPPDETVPTLAEMGIDKSGVPEGYPTLPMKGRGVIGGSSTDPPITTLAGGRS